MQLTDFSLSIKNSEKDKLINLYEYEGDFKYISREVFYKEKDKINNKWNFTQTDLPLNGKDRHSIRKTGIDDKSLKLINKKFWEKDEEKFINLIKIKTNVDSFSRPDIDMILKGWKKFFWIK